MQGRIVGIDVARGLAVLGMFVAHLGHSVGGMHSPSWFVVADGRPSALFAILAGLSIGLFTGGTRAPRGDALVWGSLRVVTRAVVIFVIGVLLMALETPVAVILPSYAVTFLLLAPFLPARRWLLAFFAGCAAIVGPTVLALLTVPDTGALSDDGGVAGFALDLVLTGYYPAFVWIAYMLLGLFLGRLDLRSTNVQMAVGVVGVGLITLGYGVGDVLQPTASTAGPLAEQLVRTDPHADSTFELLGNSGVAMALLAALLLLTSPRGAVGRLTRLLLTPVTATGAMALTAYSAHIVAIAILGNGVVWDTRSNAVLLWFVLATLVVCPVWMRFVGRGPLEWLVRQVTVNPPRNADAAQVSSPPIDNSTGRDPTWPTTS